MKLKTLKIKEETHKQLTELGMKGQTFDQIIMRLIEAYLDKRNKKL